VDETKEDKLGREYSTYGEKKNTFLSENVREGDHLEDLGVDGGVMGIKEIGWVDVEWIHLAHDRDTWWAVVNTVTNRRVP
jgi:hypothetical protein